MEVNSAGTHFLLKCFATRKLNASFLFLIEDRTVAVISQNIYITIVDMDDGKNKNRKTKLCFLCLLRDFFYKLMNNEIACVKFLLYSNQNIV